MMRIWLITCLLLISVCLGSYSQELVVKSVSLQPDDKTAIQQPVLDANGDTCALIKLKINLQGLQFTNKTQYVGEVKYADGVYYVYKSPNLSRMISYQHPDYVPAQIDLSDYGFRRLKGGKTYLALLEAPVKGLAQSIIVLKVFPLSSELTFDNKKIPLSENGVYEFPVSEGVHNYVVEEPNHHPSRSSISVGKNESKTQAIHLQPITHSVDVACNITGAHVFLDNIDYGKVGRHNIPQGKHVIRIQADGYLDVEETVDINASTPKLTYSLKKNENRIDIHATDVTIISSSKRIYKDNKEIKGWKSGSVVKFMPGSYMLSDDDGRQKIIEVGTTPMKVVL